MTTPLPSRLRKSAEVLRWLPPCTESSYEILDLVAWNIAAELTEAADALEAGRVLAEFAKTAPGRLPQRVQDAVALVAQVAQEGGGVSASAYLAKVEADPRRAAALQRARDRAAVLAERHPRCGYPYCACVGQCFAASQPGAADGVKGRR